MGLINGALQIGQSALLSDQSSLQVVGNNIANAGVDGYTRQTPGLSSLQGAPLPEGLMAGGGVALTSLQRNLDEALNGRLRTAIGDEQQSQTLQQTLAQVESTYNELSGQDLSSQINQFFLSFGDVASQPTDEPTRDLAIRAGVSLSKQMQKTRSDLLGMYGQVNDQIETAASQANDLCSQIAGLNREIVRAEAGGQGAASSLRDQRDGALKQLAGLMDIQTTETPQGAVNVYVGNQPLVELTESHGVTTTVESGAYGPTETIRFKDDNQPVTIRSGQLAGLASARDEYLSGQIGQLDNLAGVLIEQVNRLHSQGQGLDGLTDATGSESVSDPTAALNSVGLAITPVNGTFKLTVGTTTTDATTGETTVTDPQEYVIPVTLTGLGADTSLTDLATYINMNVSGVAASVTPSNQLRIQATSGHSFTLGEDSSGVLAGLGLNTFFVGHDAGDIAVESNLASHPRLLAAGLNGPAGDGSNAEAIAGLASARLASQNDSSIPQLWQAAVTTLAANSAAAKNDSDVTQSVSQSLQSQQDSISGVNTDEEAVHLMEYQRSFQAAARYISVVDQLVDEMLSMVK